jgi:hypothetical protein
MRANCQGVQKFCNGGVGVMFHGVPFLMIITDVYNALEGYYQKERTRLSDM